MTTDPRFAWIVRTMAVRPADRVLEIGPGASDSIGYLAEQAIDGMVVGVERSATAVSRAGRRHAARLESGRVRLVHADLADLDPHRLLRATGAASFDKILAVNVNLFWTKRPTAELALIRRLLAPGATLGLFYGYGTPDATAPTSPKPPLARLTEHLTEAGFAVRTIASGDLLGVLGC
ncbi:class I SAM-dependent methyltransferase [Nocardia beijingensis]|uniref:class I SAM-dependent methyltransferase n=1 Tax=Nocardia beijingensis TaxID=95162 RepID=UPI001893F8A0|nr:class I SAM-dependent methyltransferase [Nocardia beijingensis]MBF6466194.1 class I SAM-dependent methyltransferase [Nocardia beijingensis]